MQVDDLTQVRISEHRGPSRVSGRLDPARISDRQHLFPPAHWIREEVRVPMVDWKVVRTSSRWRPVHGIDLSREVPFCALLDILHDRHYALMKMRLIPQLSFAGERL